MEIDFYQKVLEDPWIFATNCAYTFDPKDAVTPIKRFPRDRYIEAYYQLLRQKKKILIPKSRQMFMTWSTLAYSLHMASWKMGRHVGIVSKKEDDANDLLDRQKFILENIKDEDLPRDFIPRYKKTYCQLDFPDNSSKITAFPSGADQLRSYAFSLLVFDEMAFWEDAKKAFASAMPTIEGGGQVICISSAAPGFFKDLVHDTVDTQAEETFEQSRKVIEPLKGIKIWQNPKNKFWVFQAHYSANDRKAEGIDEVRQSMPSEQFLQEYEIQWDSFFGKPVYPDFDNTVHINNELEPEAGLPLLLGFDFGLTPACVVCQLQSDKLVVLREYTSENMGMKRFLETIVVPGLRNHFKYWRKFDKDFLTFIDPAGNQKAQSDEYTCAQVLVDHGFRPQPGPIAWEERKQGVEHFLLKFNKKGACFQINETNCPVTTKGFRGGYQYAEKTMEIEPLKARPLKNVYSHPHDALQYVASRIVMMFNKKSSKIPAMSYSFQGTKNS